MMKMIDYYQKTLEIKSYFPEEKDNNYSVSKYLGCSKSNYEEAISVGKPEEYLYNCTNPLDFYYQLIFERIEALPQIQKIEGEREVKINDNNKIIQVNLNNKNLKDDENIINHGCSRSNYEDSIDSGNLDQYFNNCNDPDDFYYQLISERIEALPQIQKIEEERNLQEKKTKTNF